MRCKLEVVHVGRDVRRAWGGDLLLRGLRTMTAAFIGGAWLGVTMMWIFPVGMVVTMLGIFTVLMSIVGLARD
jgi:hypothetical protein